MNEASPSMSVVPNFRAGLSARLSILGILLFAEKLFLNGFVDFHLAQAAHGLGAVVRAAQHWGFRFLVAFLAAVLVFAFVQAAPQLKSIDFRVRSIRVSAIWIVAHVLCVAILIPLTYLLYRNWETPLLFAAMVTLGVVLCATAVFTAALALIPWPLWHDAARSLRSTWVYAACAALIGTGAWQWSERLWIPTATLTFDLVRRILVPIIPTLSADASTRVISTDRFAVEITEMCSGLEGMGLMLAFTVAWLLYFRKEYIFPRALLLVPAGLAAMFALNVLRITSLMLIGYAGFSDVAAYGFHSQAGWIAFIAVACGLVLWSRHSTWLNRAAARADTAAEASNPTAAYLMPLLAILAAGGG
jgi:exosortase/archaeosortase family protein